MKVQVGLEDEDGTHRAADGGGVPGEQDAPAADEGPYLAGGEAVVTGPEGGLVALPHPDVDVGAPATDPHRHNLVAYGLDGQLVQHRPG